ncbi:MAG: peptide-methionine (S)-S-oxide reductase [Leeuwenhoekiella sp.]
MENEQEIIGLGGGCHWCTEAVFQSLKGVHKVQQGYIATSPSGRSDQDTSEGLSEAVIVHFDPNVISLAELLLIHLHTHAATRQHSFRDRYRSACYYFDEKQGEQLKILMEEAQNHFAERLITQILPFHKFRESRESIQDYYLKNPDAPFCMRYIVPKLGLLKERFSELLKNQE